MIFVTVGIQLPFKRLVDMATELRDEFGLPMTIQDSKPMSPSDFEAACKKAVVILSHAGIGTIMTAKRLGKPIIIVPRRFNSGEHRNDHQFHTANALASQAGVYIANTKEELSFLLQRIDLQPATNGETPEKKKLIDTIEHAICSHETKNEGSSIVIILIGAFTVGLIAVLIATVSRYFQ